MKKLESKPYCLIRRGKELKEFLPVHMRKDINEELIYGILLDVKALDEINENTPEEFHEYFFGYEKDASKPSEVKP